MSVTAVISFLWNAAPARGCIWSPGYSTGFHNNLCQGDSCRRTDNSCPEVAGWSPHRDKASLHPREIHRDSGTPFHLLPVQVQLRTIRKVPADRIVRAPLREAKGRRSTNSQETFFASCPSADSGLTWRRRVAKQNQRLFRGGLGGCFYLVVSRVQIVLCSKSILLHALLTPALPHLFVFSSFVFGLK
jgi:hypothetical protein